MAGEFRNVGGGEVRVIEMWLDHLPRWVPLLTSITAIVISILAYRRGAPPVLPKAWIVLVGQGPLGTTYRVHVLNHTDRTVKLKSIKGMRGMKISFPPKRNDDNSSLVRLNPNPEQVAEHFQGSWASSLSLDKELPPNGSFEGNIVLPITPTKVIIKPSIALCISTMSRTIKSRAITLPIMAPEATISKV